MEVEALLENELKATARHSELDQSTKTKDKSKDAHDPSKNNENKCGDSQPSPRLDPLYDEDDDFEALNHSFPGCNPAEDVIEDRGLKKRLMLLKYMEDKVEENANLERLQANARTRLYLFQDKASMYDNEHFDTQKTNIVLRYKFYN